MTSRVLAGITEFKMKVVTSAHGEAVAVLNRNKPAFYCVPAAAYEALMDKLEDMELFKIAKERANEESISVDFNDL